MSSEPLHPPYIVTLPRTLVRWLDVNSQNGQLTRTRGFFTIPPFNINSYGPPQSIWAIVGEFNYSSPNAFCIDLKHTDFNGLNAGVGYVVIRTSGQILIGNALSYVRYLLTGLSQLPIIGSSINISEMEASGITIYDGEPITPNFTIELWSVDGFVILNNPFTIYTSVLSNIDYRFGDDFSLVQASNLNANLFSRNIGSNTFQIPLQFNNTYS